MTPSCCSEPSKMPHGQVHQLRITDSTKLLMLPITESQSCHAHLLRAVLAWQHWYSWQQQQRYLANGLWAGVVSAWLPILIP